MTSVTIIVKERQTGAPISGAPVQKDGYDAGTTNEQGVRQLDTPPGKVKFQTTVFEKTVQKTIEIGDEPVVVELEPELDLQVIVSDPVDFQLPRVYARRGEVVGLDVVFDNRLATKPSTTVTWAVSGGKQVGTRQGPRALWDTTQADGEQVVRVTVSDNNSGAMFSAEHPFYVTAPFEGSQAPGTATVSEATAVSSISPVPVTLASSQIPPTADQVLWVAIRNRTRAISFNSYRDFIDRVLCGDDPTGAGDANSTLLARRQQFGGLPIQGVAAYELLKTATQIFLLLECGAAVEETSRYTGELRYDPVEEVPRLGREVLFDEIPGLLTAYMGNGPLPYIQRVLDAAFVGRPAQENVNFFCGGYLTSRAECPPLLELIWSYWHEEALLVQTMNALSLRFQNIRRGERDPLSHLEMAPLYPVNNLLWGYIQDEDNRLSVPRRNYEYNHHYGLKLFGSAIGDFKPADSRSQFLDAFHNLLYRTIQFYKQDDDATFKADSFPVLNALREVHQELTKGMHNQYGDLPWEARVEMLMEQWLLSRPEVRQFLQSRDMVAYREAWMPQVDTMNQLQGWTDVSVTHFNSLAVYGEQLLLSIRFGDWSDVTEPAQAGNWARYWRPEIQNYLHAYRAATEVDLTLTTTDSEQKRQRTMLPSELLRLRSSKARAALPQSEPAQPVPGFRQRRVARIPSNGDS